mmetsp:Transcript_18912/g.64077  ORF Transcript_18912/g.64077 Transcript_18912/m.64077 type:complete len:209 (+) Transcript_18912:892-1518(+)
MHVKASTPCTCCSTVQPSLASSINSLASRAVAAAAAASMSARALAASRRESKCARTFTSMSSSASTLPCSPDTRGRLQVPCVCAGPRQSQQKLKRQLAHTMEGQPSVRSIRAPQLGHGLVPFLASLESWSTNPSSASTYASLSRHFASCSHVAGACAPPSHDMQKRKPHRRHCTDAGSASSATTTTPPHPRGFLQLPTLTACSPQCVS